MSLLSYPLCPSSPVLISHLGLLSYASLSWDAAKGESCQWLLPRTLVQWRHPGTDSSSYNSRVCLSHLALAQGAPVHYAFLMSDP